jgi:hypothetical protein
MCMAVAGIIGAGLSLAGSAINASGAMAEGRAKQNIANQNAALLIQQGKYEAQQIRKKGMRVNSRTATQAGGRGLMLAGSMLDIMADSSAQAEIDATNTEKTAEAQGRVQKAQGEAAMTQARYSATGAIIGGATNFLRMI